MKNSLIINQYSIRFDPPADREGHELDVDNLYMWAKSLKHLGKTEVALKKIEEAIQLESSDRKTMMVSDKFYQHYF